jgi:hypothetical protein
MTGKRLNPYILTVMMALGFWLVIAHAVFAFRHPWATDTQRFLHTFDALLFRQVRRPEAK